MAQKAINSTTELKLEFKSSCPNPQTKTSLPALFFLPAMFMTLIWLATLMFPVTTVLELCWKLMLSLLLLLLLLKIKRDEIQNADNYSQCHLGTPFTECHCWQQPKPLFCQLPLRGLQNVPCATGIASQFHGAQWHRSEQPKSSNQRLPSEYNKLIFLRLYFY